MPLGDPSMRVPCAIMINVLGGGAKQDAPTQEELVDATMAPIDVRPSPPTLLPSLLRLAVLKLSGGRGTLCLFRLIAGQKLSSFLHTVANS